MGFVAFGAAAGLTSTTFGAGAFTAGLADLATGALAAGLAAGAFALTGAGLAFAGAALGAGFAAADFFAGVLSFAITKPFLVRPLFAVAANMPIHRADFKWFFVQRTKL